jgi:PIN domain nuclease of toxin-antitoxin system
MRVLLDTQCWLWMLSAPDRLSPRARALVSGSRHDLVLSAVSAWEIAVKHALGKIDLPADPVEYVTSRMTTSAVLPLAVTHAHALQVARLPMHHRDPFDRLLVAQAQLENLPLLTADRQLAAYGISILDA